MTKSKRLSRKYFRICSWNCASASKRGAGIQRLAHDFEFLCLQGTRTRPESAARIAWLPGPPETRKARNDDCNSHGSTKHVSAIDLRQWSTSSREVQGIRPAGPKRQSVRDQQMYPRTVSTKSSWDSSEEQADELRNSLVTCDDFKPQCQIKHAGSMGQPSQEKHSARRHGWRPLQPSNDSVTNTPSITTRERGKHHRLRSRLNKNVEC